MNDFLIFFAPFIIMFVAIALAFLVSKKDDSIVEE